MFPDLVLERPVGRLVPSVIAGDNADLVAAVAPLYLDRGPVVDVTYGRGMFWRRFRPDDLVCHDIRLDGVDFGALPEPDGYAHAVVFDPPYSPSGGRTTTTVPDYVDRYGLEKRTPAIIAAMFRRGLGECARICAPGGYVLAKCDDYVESARLHLGHVDMLAAADEVGLAVWDRVIHHAGPGVGGHNISTPIRTRKAHSYLLVFVHKRRANRRMSDGRRSSSRAAS